MAFLKFSNGLLKFGNGVLGFKEAQPDPYNPLNLPSNTIRFKYKAGENPTSDLAGKGTLTLIDETENIWDLNFSTCEELFKYKSNLIEVLGANTTGITSMKKMFEKCGGLTNVALFDTSSVTNVIGMFDYCSNLVSVPEFDTKNVTHFGDTSNNYGMFSQCSKLTSLPSIDLSSAITIECICYSCSNLTAIPEFKNISSTITKVDYAFNYTPKVASGVLELYNVLSTLSPVPSHNDTFYQCGQTVNPTVYNQIPSSWK